MPRPVHGAPYLEVRHGVYQIRWYEPASEEAKRRNPQARGKAFRVGLRTRDAKEAAARLAAFITEGHNNIWSTGKLTVGMALAQYYDEHVREHVVAERRARVILGHLAKFFGQMPLEDVSRASCRDYGKWRAGVAPATVQRELAILRAAAIHAFKEGRITQLPRFQIASIAEPTKITRDLWLTKDEYALLFRKAADKAEYAAMLGDERGERRYRRLLDFIVLAYGWGARRESVAKMEVTQVELEAGVVRLAKPGEKLTKKRRPVLPIFPEQREVLERLVRQAIDGFLFGPQYEVYSPFRALCRECGLDAKARPHVIRHSRATHMLQDGESIYKVAKLLGDTVKTVEAVYGHHSPGWIAEVAR
jgi:integrase